MNAADKKVLGELITRLRSMEDEAASISSDIHALADAEREKFDNMSDGLQQSEKGQAIEEWANGLESAVSSIDDIAQSIGDAASELDSLGD
jgi:hypothetical protein